ncbi:hypothetical protein Salat_1365800 [Sesamum alatum]|uniref:FAS1 domain-containing protein n=1 Tax=Sesamum alatum TaxID=300844 RepID=A0AAE1YIX0_9LAMI|nr:hypothetical protein Salat_1365800 [Sesamum alatum]
MANPSPPSPPAKSSTLLLFLFLLLPTANSITAGVSFSTTFRELETMLEALRNQGYTLFTNAITTSDIQYQLLSTTTAATSPFTLFAPKDSPLRALGMNSDAAAYVSTLRYHIIPNHRHTLTDLQNLSSPFLDTLLPHYSVLIGKIQDGDVLYGNATVGLMVDGVRLSDPDLFLGSRIAVHGIDGILVMGLNMFQHLDGIDKVPESFPPAESPSWLSGFDRNNNMQGNEFGWNIGVAPAPEDEGERVKKKKRGRRHRRGRGHHERSRRHHRAFHGHRRDDGMAAKGY